MKSFTLIELLVTISIILILAITIVPNFHLADSKIALERAAYKMAQQIRSVEEMAMSSKGTPASKFVTNLFPQGGYGIYFKINTDSNSYYIFADCNGNQQYDVGVATGDCANSPNGAGAYREMVEEVFLDSGIKIKQDSGPHRLNSVLFVPPDPEIRMQPAPPSGPRIYLFSTKDVTKCAAVYINNVGNVEIKNEPCS
jgi:type II secretory pathway pseudopilin PulG